MKKTNQQNVSLRIEHMLKGQPFAYTVIEVQQWLWSKGVRVTEGTVRQHLNGYMYMGLVRRNKSARHECKQCFVYSWINE